MSNVSSLSDLRKKQEEAQNQEGKRDEFFAGGLDQRGGGSGLAVVGPEGRNNPNNPGAGGSIFDSLVERASQPPSGAEPTSTDGTSTKITLYRNGFTVNDGPLRDLTSPSSTAFLSSLMRGEVPDELLRGRAGGREAGSNMDVSLDDKRGEDYVAPPPPAYIAFSGPAATLRDASASSTAGNGASNAMIFTSELFSDVDLSAAIDDTQPITTIQIRTIEGKKIKIRINTTATVMQLAAMIARDTGSAVRGFTMSAGFPPQDVRDATISIAEAGLAGAAVTLKAFTTS